MRDNSALVDLIRVDALSHDVSHHRDMITRIIYVDMRGGSRDTFVTASRDGTLRFWSPTTMLPVRTIQHAENNKRFLSSTIDARVLDGGMTGGGIPGSDKRSIARHRHARPLSLDSRRQFRRRPADVSPRTCAMKMLHKSITSHSSPP